MSTAAKDRIYVRLSPHRCEACSRIAAFRELHPELVVNDPRLVFFASGDKGAKGQFKDRHPHP